MSDEKPGVIPVIQFENTLSPQKGGEVEPRLREFTFHKKAVFDETLDEQIKKAIQDVKEEQQEEKPPLTLPEN